MVAGCERYTKTLLKAPSTYKRTSEYTHSRSSSWEEIKSMGGMVFDWGEDPPEPWVHYVELGYSANNAFGVAIDGKTQCLFQTIDPRAPIEMNVDVAVSRAIGLREGTYPRLLADERVAQTREKPQPRSCCL